MFQGRAQKSAEATFLRRERLQRKHADLPLQNTKAEWDTTDPVLYGWFKEVQQYGEGFTF